MFTFLLILQSLVAAALVAVILMQRSEGGGLGVGGSSSGFMTARGAADFLTRSTAILATIFIILAIALAAIAGVSRQPTTLDTSLANQVAPASPTPGVPVPGQQAPQQQQPAQQAPQQQAPANDTEPAVPLAQ
ncbi:MAG TPA: preprotein translocase subunit SecG [Sphingomicrobium sp.]|nr:preprotein translocase subunit SecG [Sphingomicrobium sp.]